MQIQQALQKLLDKHNLTADEMRSVMRQQVASMQRSVIEEMNSLSGLPQYKKRARQYSGKLVIGSFSYPEKNPGCMFILFQVMER